MSDDLLKPDEIEALLKAAGNGGSAGDPKSINSGATGADPRRTGVHASGVEATRAKPGVRGGRRATKSPTERLLEQAEAGLAAAVSSDVQGMNGVPPDLGNVASFEFQSFDPLTNIDGDGVGLQALQDVELDLRIELGRTELLIEEVLQLREGSVVPLNKLAGDPVDVLVNGRLIARGEVLVLNDNFCVRIAEIVAPTI